MFIEKSVKTKQNKQIDENIKFPYCLDPDHSPPSFLFIPEGEVKIHVCPSCGEKFVLMPNVFK